ncbi:MAG: type II and III secretion system protein, partial [bacterium]
GIVLKVTPLITQEKEIMLSLEPEISDVAEIGRDGLPIVNRRSLKTTLIVKNGETIAIGGLLQERKEKKTIGIPLLDRIPLLGKILFSHTITKAYQTELVVFITSYIEE